MEDTTTATITTIREVGKHDGQAVTIRGWLYNLRESGKLLFPHLPRRQRHHPGRGAEEPGFAGSCSTRSRALTQESSVIVDRQSSRRQARARRLRTGRHRRAGGAAGDPEDDPYPDHAEGAWRRLPDGASPPLDALAAAGRDPARARGDHQGGARLLRRARIHADRSADSYAGRLRRHHHAVSGGLLRRAGVSSRSPASSISKRRRWRWARSTSFGPTFRAEKSKTRRHLTEFWMVEPEVAYATLDDLMELAEDFITSHRAERAWRSARPELETIGRDIAKLEKIATPFPRITYDEAVKMLQEGHAKGLLENKFEWGGDFGSPDETYISSQFDRPVMVHRYPAEVRRSTWSPIRSGRIWRSAWTCWRPKAMARSSADRSAWRSYDLLLQAHSRARAAGRGVQVVSRPAQVRRRAARAASAWALSAPWPGFAAWSTCARPFRSRGR